MLLIRLVLGWIFIYAGAGKAFGAFGGMGIEVVKGFVGQIMPAFLPASVWAYMLAYGELIGGITVFFGLLARLGSIPIIISMLVAIFTATGKMGFMPPTGNGYAFNLALLAMGAAVLIAGPGLISVDAFIFRRGLWARGPQPLSEPVRRA